MEYDVKELGRLVEAKDIAGLKSFMKTHNLVVKKGKIVPKDNVVIEFKTQAAFWHQRQQARKILLNSLN